MRLGGFVPPRTHDGGNVAVCASTELCRAGLEEVLARTGGLRDVITARTMAEFVPRCGNEGPDVALLEVQAAGTSTRDAITDLSQMPPAVRLIGMCSGRQSERHFGELRGLGVHQAASVRHEDDRLSLQGAFEPVPILKQSELSALTPREADALAHGNGGPTAQIVDRLEVTPKAIENHKQRIYSKLRVPSPSDAVSVAFQRGTVDAEDAPVCQSGPDLLSSA
jgi:DNA-binding NarL/FixJ family response regulator